MDNFPHMAFLEKANTAVFNRRDESLAEWCMLTLCETWLELDGDKYRCKETLARVRVDKGGNLPRLVTLVWRVEHVESSHLAASTAGSVVLAE